MNYLKGMKLSLPYRDAWRFLPLLALVVVGCDLPGRPRPEDRPVPADQVMAFSVLYGQNCAGCHGVDGKLGPAPPLNDPLFRAIVLAEDLKDVITNGRKGTLMPAFAKENGGVLTAAQIEVLVKEIKGIPYKSKSEVMPDAATIAPKWGTPAKPPVAVPALAGKTPPEGGTATKGAVVFARACAICHGDYGKCIAINDPVFLALTSNQVLRRYIITGRSDLGMPDYAGQRPDDNNFAPLTDQEVTDLVALLASWRLEK